MGSSAVVPGSAIARLGVTDLGVRLLGALFALSVAGPSRALAASCGDDVGGLRIACSCGDDVVSDTVLAASDPVVAESCPGDGLVVFVPSESNGITLNLGGRSIVGRGTGVGIRVVRGGRVGSTILGGGEGGRRAEIANFRTGISAHGRNDLVALVGIDVHDNRSDGLRLHTSGVRVEDVKSQSNGRDGLSLSGHANEVTGVVAERNASEGVQIRGSGTTINAETSDNRGHGLAVAGRGNRVEAAISNGNGGAGLLTSGAGHEVGDIQTNGNMGGDVAGRAGATR
jgi:hypothetical protein